ncbi:hypothetical protein ElyMa_004730900 [Elysia marginata]|uniref:Uncharacterized protein n=1 Tax=Elysia marginata TaxID=1093978 RepID=A0AAV4IFX4_9GAST|nr:hypothetical protein ElyMa_004730900 [Elysia marginata]
MAPALICAVTKLVPENPSLLGELGPTQTYHTIPVLVIWKIPVHVFFLIENKLDQHSTRLQSTSPAGRQMSFPFLYALPFFSHMYNQQLRCRQLKDTVAPARRWSATLAFGLRILKLG